MTKTLPSLALCLLLAGLLPPTTTAFRPSSPIQHQAQPQPRTTAAGVRMQSTAGGSGYQEQLARARADKAARQAAAAAGQPYQPPPPPPPPAPMPMMAQQQQAPPQQAPTAYYQAAPPPTPQTGMLPGGTQDAVATLLSILGERLGSGRPLPQQRLQAFTQAAEALVAEARAAASVAAPVQYVQPAPPAPQQYYSQPPAQQQPQQQQQYQQQQPTTQPAGAPVYRPTGFEQDEDTPWHLGCV
jgi:hypothetical protein